MSAARPERRQAGGRTVAWGVAYSAAAYAIWAMFPVYFKAVAQVPAMQVLAHRVVWSLLFLGIVVAVGGGWKRCRLALVYGEAFSPSSVVVFACIWAGLAIYSLDALRRSA